MTKFTNRTHKHHRSGRTDAPIKHKYDYDNAKLTSGTAFNEFSTNNTQNLVEYNQHFMGRPGRRKMVEKVIRYKYPSCVHTNYQREHRGYNTVKGVGGSTKFEPWNVEKEHKIIKYPRAETTTQNMRTFKDFKVKPKPAQTPDVPKKQLPYPVKTSNQQHY